MGKKLDRIIDIFKQISTIPRCSRNEDQISQWLGQRALDMGFENRHDGVGNLVINVPASPGYENGPVVVLQGHMDMVCEKTADSIHDFTKDPILFVFDGEWLRADRTTLGADNGIALALALALAEDKSVAHPPLELLFTVDEESGLTGADALEPGFVRGKILLNIDSENEGAFTVGCAGGKNTTITYPLSFVKYPETYKICNIQVHGLRGGHSGIDIHTHRANANKLLARILNKLRGQSTIRLISADGGTAHNAIPRSAGAVFACDSTDVDRLQDITAEFEKTIIREYAGVEISLAVSFVINDSQIDGPMAVSSEDTQKIINLLNALPNGINDMTIGFKGLVETSNNLARIRTNPDSMVVLSSQRSMVMSRLEMITSRIESIAALAGAAADTDKEYQAWVPNLDSPLLGRCLETYQGLFGQKPKVESIHAGLECGIIGGKYGNMDMISLGPTMKNPHSPEERLHLPSVEKVWTFLVALLKGYRK
ncbi:MAG: aminoacyl-histidine dipeptidase [Deltaproteobacteria bacterium]|nr:aminoacyl-histidine dipeptidase [Deltaproteobacteria bacterium]